MAPGKLLVDNVYHGYAVPTPVTDGKHVFALFGSGVLAGTAFAAAKIMFVLALLAFFISAVVEVTRRGAP